MVEAIVEMMGEIYMNYRHVDFYLSTLIFMKFNFIFTKAIESVSVKYGEVKIIHK